MAERKYFRFAAGAPSFIPEWVGSLYTNETNGDEYVAVGTTTISDWRKLASAEIANVWTKQQNFDNGALVFATPLTWDLAVNQSTSIVLTGDITINAPLNIVPHGTYIIQLTQDATGTRLVTWDAAFKFSGGTPPTLTTTGSKTDIITFVANAAGDALRASSILDFD